MIAGRTFWIAPLPSSTIAAITRTPFTGLAKAQSEAYSMRRDELRREYPAAI